MRRYLIGTALVAVLWGVLATAVVPWVIGEAYRGESLSVLNRLIEGQESRSLEDYLVVWRSLATTLTLGLAVLAIGGALVVRFPGALRALVDALLGSLPLLRAGDVAAMAAFSGIVFGLAEATRAVWSYRVLQRAAGAVVSAEVFWMAPLAATVVFTLVAWPLVAASRWARLGARGAGATPACFVGLGVYGFGRSLGAGLQTWALIVLCVGSAVAATRLIAGHPETSLRWIRRAAITGATGLAIFGLAITPWRRGTEWWQRLGLSDGLTDAPNVIVIVWDTVRSRSLSLYGHDRETTPGLVELAAASVVFDRASSASPWTLPSHASMFTGRYPVEHLANHDVPLGPEYPTLAEVLSDRGYQTAGFAANKYYAGPGFGLHRGFQWYQSWNRVGVASIFSSWWISSQLGWSAASLLGYQTSLRISAEDVNESFLRWLDRKESGRPFFAFLNLFDAHEPYRPPDSFGFRFSDASRRHEWLSDRTVYSESDLEALRDAYDSCIYYLDYALQRLLVDLDARGEMENTLVVLTSDHGEALGEHAPDLLGHENNVYAEVLSVPLVFHFPTRLPGGIRRDEPVSLVDLPATIMDIVQGGPVASSFPGRSLLPHIMSAEATETVSASWAETDAMEWHRAYGNWPVSRGPLHSLMDTTYQYIVDAEGGEELYDLAADPWEERNLAGDPEASATLQERRRELAALRERASPAN